MGRQMAHAVQCFEDQIYDYLPHKVHQLCYPLPKQCTTGESFNISTTGNSSWWNNVLGLAHINQLILKVNRKIGLIWKVSEHLPSCAENIYTMYIRPIIDYGCVIYQYDNCSKHLQDKLEDAQRRGAVACTHAFSRTPTSTLLTELYWAGQHYQVSTRQDYFQILQLYKMKHQLTPDYLRTNFTTTTWTLLWISNSIQQQLRSSI